MNPQELKDFRDSRNTSPEYSDFTINLNNVYQIFKVIKRTF